LGESVGKAADTVSRGSPPASLALQGGRVERVENGRDLRDVEGPSVTVSPSASQSERGSRDHRRLGLRPAATLPKW
jgi:hypothetical protein